MRRAPTRNHNRLDFCITTTRNFTQTITSFKHSQQALRNLANQTQARTDTVHSKEKNGPRFGMSADGCHVAPILSDISYISRKRIRVPESVVQRPKPISALYPSKDPLDFTTYSYTHPPYFSLRLRECGLYLIALLDD